MTEIIIIAGVAENGVIGDRGKLPWHISEDLKRFKSLTSGNPVIMGRKTYESIIKFLGKPLPDRTNIVITRQASYIVPDGVVVCGSVPSAIERAKEFGEKVFVIGGQNIYEQTISLADKLEITKVHKQFEGDAYFPKFDKNVWKMVFKEERENNGIGFSFLTFEKDEGVKKQKGMFIAFEGIDGSGKSTQIRKLAEHIFKKGKYNHVVLTRNPYKDVKIRETIVADDKPESDAEKLAELFIADRLVHAEEFVKPNLQLGHFVVSDRHKLSTVVYQSAQGLNMSDLIEKQKDIIDADMTFIIDISPEEAVARMSKEGVATRGVEHKFEANREFTLKLRENYKKVADLLSFEGKKVFVVDGSGSPEEVFLRVREIFDKGLGNYRFW